MPQYFVGFFPQPSYDQGKRKIGITEAVCPSISLHTKKAEPSVWGFIWLTWTERKEQKTELKPIWIKSDLKSMHVCFDGQWSAEQPTNFQVIGQGALHPKIFI